MNKNLLTYKKSGVDIKAADKFIKFISSISSKKKGKKKFNNIGGFGSITNIPNNLKNPKIVACTDGVGTKIEIANLLKKSDPNLSEKYIDLALKIENKPEAIILKSHLLINRYQYIVAINLLEKLKLFSINA